ncbi:MAG: alkaline phosphatase family protein, partial [Flavihumibacter sp.]
ENDKTTLAAVQQVLEQRSDEEKKLFRIISRKELDRIGGNPEVAFALNAIGTAYFDNNSNGASVRPGKGGGHGYFPDEPQIQTGFVATGPGIRKGSVVREMNVRDIAPLVARMLNLPLTTADGKIPAGILSTGN